MPQIPSDLLESLRHLLGPKGFTVEREAIEPWLTDWRGRFHGESRALLSPASVEEVAEIVRFAAKYSVPLVPQGGNTSMVGGATPPPDGSALILSLRRMNRIRSISTENAVAVAEAGVILANLHEAAAAQKMRFPLILGSKGSATLGGLISTNAGGTQVLRFGTMRALTLGIEAVFPDGSIYHGLEPLKKDNRGYDLRHLLIGAEGTIGIITAASLTLVPAILDRAVGWVGLESPQQALALLRGIEARASDSIEGFEIIPEDSLARVLAHIPGTRRPLVGAHRWHALIEIVRTDPEEESPGDLLGSLLASGMEKGLCADATIAATEAQAEAFWKLRDSISEAERASGPALQHDISVPVPGMPDFMIDAAAQVELKFPGVHASAFGHLGDGNVHFHVRAPDGVQAGWVEMSGPAITEYVHDLVIASQGSISAEHGIGQMKRRENARLADPARLMALKAVKQAFDPANLLNPGKLVPLATDETAP